MSAALAPTLFRAVAYQLQGPHTPEHLQQPEVHVFIEAADIAEAGRMLLDVLPTLWRCHRTDVEFYNLSTEADLLGSQGPGPAEMGEAALLVCGWFHGPLICRADRTLALVSPRTLARLHRARRLALPWAQRQREAALLAAGCSRGAAAARAHAERERAEAAGSADMGATC